MLGLMGFSGSLPLYVIHRYYNLCLLIGQIKMLACLLDILSPPLLRLTSRKPLVNSHLMCDPTIRQPGFDLLRQHWSLLNRFRTEQGHCGACRRKQLTDTDLCPCRETQTMSHIVESCPLTKLNSGYTLQKKTLFPG